MQFMVKGTLQHALTAELRALLAAEHARMHALQEQGLIETLYVAADRSGAWLVMQGESQESVEVPLASLPLYRFAVYTLTPLADAAQQPEGAPRVAP
jgi:muconolactone delta-isomerase